MTSRTSAGPDAPVASRAEDQLNRWWFAREVYELATTAPSEWSIRIGVYGRWGTGKSSILSFLRQMARSDSNITVDFNPWGCTSIAEMWSNFIEAVYAGFRDADVPVGGEKLASLKRWARDTARGAREVFEGEQYASSIARLLDISAASYLADGAVELRRLRAEASTKRIIVLIDDVDRVNPELLANLFYSLKEILNVEGYAFVLALDPEVVGAALGKHHPGWGDGKRFLEKIIDFPKHLPDPTSASLLAMVEQDIARYASFVDLSALRAIFDLCPTNPRLLRQFVRHL